MKIPWMLLLICLLALGLAACARSGPEAAEAPEEEMPENTVPDNFGAEEFSVEHDGRTIYGTLYVPSQHEEKVPAIILSHSANLTSDSMRSYGERLASQGYVAYAFDFCGGSKKSRSDGDPADMTVFTEMEDLKAVLAAIRNLEYVDEQAVFLLGTSQGGLVSALVADECPDDVKGLILFYPAFNLAELAQKYCGKLPTTTDRLFYSSLLEYDVYEHIGAFPGDVLILHGSRDFIVPYSYSERAAECYAHCTLIKIDGASHGFNSENYAIGGDFDEETWSYAVRYLEEHTA